MFESSLLPERKGKDARLIRGIAFGSIAVQVVAVTAFIVVPLIYPDTLPSVIHPAKMTRVELKRPEPKPIPLKPQVVPVTNQSALAAPTHFVQLTVETRRGGIISHAPSTSDAEPVLTLGGGNQMASGFNPNSGFGSPAGTGTSPIVVVSTPAPAVSGAPLRVSSGASAGLLIDPIRPIYPMVAKAAHQQGSVRVTAVIDRTGRIINAQVVDGPVMLRDAAITAVRDARYRPYLLNGQPTEVVTTFTITFTMSV